MSKAEDLAKELYPDWEKTGVPTFDGQEESMVRIQRVAYIKGYHQAEEDLELTWEDISKIISIDQHICGTMGISNYTHNHQQAMEEVLKRFKDYKK